jgi:hypothetical protein
VMVELTALTYGRDQYKACGREVSGSTSIWHSIVSYVLTAVFVHHY